MERDDETGLILRAQVGDREALEALLGAVQPAVHRYVSRIAGPDHAPDVVQEVLIAVARKLAWLTEPRVVRAVQRRVGGGSHKGHSVKVPPLMLPNVCLSRRLQELRAAIGIAGIL